MSSSAIVSLFQSSLACLAVTMLVGLSPASARAQSAQAQPVQAVAAAAAQSDAGAASTASTVLKMPTALTAPATSNAAIQPILSTTTQLPDASAVGPLPSKAATGWAHVMTPSTTGSTAATNIGTTAAASVPNPGVSGVPAGQSQADGLELLSPAERQTYQRAASAFTGFCHEWERLLHEREVNNLEHLSWSEAGGLETATYTGYGKVESCECKESKEGLPIGKIRYLEMNYAIVGKTVDEARHAAPKLMHEISTLEIFSWDKGKWFY